MIIMRAISISLPIASRRHAGIRQIYLSCWADRLPYLSLIGGNQSIVAEVLYIIHFPTICIGWLRLGRNIAGNYSRLLDFVTQASDINFETHETTNRCDNFLPDLASYALTKYQFLIPCASEKL